MNADRLAALGVATPPAMLGLTLTEIDLILRIVLTLVGIATGVASFIYYRKKTPK